MNTWKTPEKTITHHNWYKFPVNKWKGPGYPTAACPGAVPWIHRARQEGRRLTSRAVCSLTAGETLRIFGALFSLCLSQDSGPLILLSEEPWLFNRQVVPWTFSTPFSQACGSKAELISCIFKVLSGDLRGQQLLHTSF